MNDNIRIVSRLSRKAKINIIIVIFLVFIVITILTSLSQVKNIVEKREKVIELEEKLNWYRNENIKLLALEKSLYEEEAIEIEARKQFNMGAEDEVNVSVIIEDDTPRQDALNSKNLSSDDKAYSESDLWGNIKAFYDNEIKN